MGWEYGPSGLCGKTRNLARWLGKNAQSGSTGKMLRFFLELSRVGSLSEAARRLRVDHLHRGAAGGGAGARAGIPAVRPRPARLCVLTARGTAFVAPAERMEAEVLALSRRAAGEAPDLEGVVRLTTIESFASRIVAPALPAFHQRYPGIVIELISENRALNLTKREADLALRIGRPPEGALSRGGSRNLLMAFTVRATMCARARAAMRWSRSARR